MLDVLAFSTHNFQLFRSWMQLIQFLTFSSFISFLMSSSHLFFGLSNGLVSIGFHLYTFLTILSSGIQCKWPKQLNLCAFIWIMFLCPINLSNSSFVLILYAPSASLVGPKIFLNTFLSNTISLIFIVSFRTHVVKRTSFYLCEVQYSWHSNRESNRCLL